MTAYYNEIEPFAAAWLRNLIGAGLIAPGDVDERDIRDVRPADLRGYAQCHFFAGIGGWSLALRMAGWLDDRPVWTGSCPCQPFSTAGKNKGVADDRHLWPVWSGLLRECRPAVVFGEQVPNAIAHGWLDLVFADLEGAGYACGAAIAPAAGAGAPHIRDRLWFVAADTDGKSQYGQPVHAEMAAIPEPVADAGGGRRGGPGGREVEQPRGAEAVRTGAVAHTDAPGPSIGGESLLLVQRAATLRSRWWATEPDVGRVAHGVPGRVGRLRAYGNAIVPQVAAEFIGAYLDTLDAASAGV